MKSRTELRLERALIYCFLITVSLLADDAGASQCVSEQQTIQAGDLPLVAEFQKRVEGYVTLHRLLEGQVPTLEVSEDPKEIQAAIEALQKKLRQARATARQGDIFTAKIAPLFRRLVREVFPEGETLRLLSMIAEETPKTLIRPRVNGSYPAGTSLSMMPTNLLLVFPSLPEELQYRFVDRDLILWDVHANLVVDVVPNAIVPDLTWQKTTRWWTTMGERALPPAHSLARALWILRPRSVEGFGCSSPRLRLAVSISERIESVFNSIIRAVTC